MAIDATGRTDVTKQLQRFVASVPDGSVVQFRRGSRYRVEGTLFVDGRRDLTFLGPATIFATTQGDRKRSQWWIRGGSDITFRNITVRGANALGGTGRAAYVARLEAQHGFRFEGVNRVELDRVRVSNVYGDFVYLGRDVHRVASGNVWIHDSVFRRNGRQGIAVTDAAGVIIERNRFDDTRRSTIDLEPTGHRWRVDRVFVLNNTVGRGRLLFVASHGQGPVNNVVISGNRLHGHGLTIDVLPPKHRRRKNWVVADNTSDSTVRTRPLRFASIDGLLIDQNRQVVSGGAPALVLSNVCGAQVSGNDFGAARVKRAGRQCRARLAIPVPPAFPGRSASSGTPLPSGGVGRTQREPGRAIGWIVPLFAMAALGVTSLVVVRVRRRSSRR